MVDSYDVAWFDDRRFYKLYQRMVVIFDRLYSGSDKSKAMRICSKWNRWSRRQDWNKLGTSDV